ncbi:universal stress protein [Paenibacillus glycinis]|uniref:Universal stress protein n=1 Tax=Paenibacillus glycinis TaxID=2697035 RepID=A0ABW9XZ16_9BACL|nr:universal stress protein [Paenibacillus glycinis]
MVAYDGSEMAEKSLRQAIKLTMHNNRAELHVLHAI